jgi:3-(3-hydroxy-phenyl)propionate hydroxylase
MHEHDVVIAGGGPTGLMLAAELTLAGVRPVVVEPRLTQELDGSRAGGVHARTIEVLEQRGVADRFLAEGQLHPMFGFAHAGLDLSDLPSRHRGVLGLVQKRFERILAGWVLDELGVEILRGRQVVGLDQDEAGVDVALSDGSTLRARYLVGCDGGRSTVRRSAGIDFPGSDPTVSWMIAEVEMDGAPELGFRFDAAGRRHALGQREPGGPIGAVLLEDEVEHDAEPTLDELRAKLVEIWGSDFGLRRASWLSRFTDVARQAAEYRRGRVLLAGDAAHIHPPMGGQGMGTGIQDAVNLGWKLAQVVHGISPDSLLDTYHAERHPVGSRVIRNAIAQVPLGLTDPRHEALRSIVADMAAMDEPRRMLGAALAGLDVHYDLGVGHPLLGRRMPDLDLETEAGPTRVLALLHEARPVLLQLRGAEPRVDVSPWSGRVRAVAATADPQVELPVLGSVDTPPAVLLRPDGYVVWTGEAVDPELPAAIDTWFGARAA